ncbi:MAG: isoleucyl-tRNA synthetase, isoleucyl-tRNA synthetase [Parcubacteria group bacterium]|nr:isoleucyl-tRNA synthetase, isoleucyl-tRNA synthetase [Parcubacteria group bacterium]
MPEDKGLSRSQREEKVLQFWKDNSIFEKSLEKPSPKGEFVFYEGPPTANGRPALHHLEARSFKDAIPRFKTMQGFHVRRKAGWDTHGLPVEIEAEKTLGLKSKKEIEAYGVAKFNAECKRSVGKYIDEWARFTDRIGYWTDLDDAYFTYHNSYIESVWSVLAHVEKRKLLYKDYKVVPWCPRCGTALSSHELAQGYKDVKDLSLYVKFKLVDFPNAYFLAWTTTPWTLPGNVALAVGPGITYVEAKVGETIYVLAKERLSTLTEEYEVIAEHKGKDMVGMKYEPLYPFVENNGKAFQIYPADFVTTEDGTGIVHTAVMYGQEDFELGTKVGLPKVHLVNPDATFKDGLDWLSGRSVIDETLAVDILKDLQARGLFYHKENHLHSYPFCWRCKTRLIYYARDSWYIRMSEVRDDLVKGNQEIHWEPEYIQEGRFGDWLREVKDWAISRERYWGTPLPIWQTADGERLVVDSIDTLKKHTKRSGNSYFVMRHGGTEGNRQEIVSYNNQANDHLTEEGKIGVETAAEKLKGEKFDLIIASPFARAQETAKIVQETIGFDADIITDERIQEINPGDYDGKSWFDYHEAVSSEKDWFKGKPHGGESYEEVQKRVGEFLYDLETTYKDKKILVVTHGGPAWLLHAVSGAYLPTNKEYKVPEHTVPTKIFVPEFTRFMNAEVRELLFVPLPHDENYTVDLHKPFIDDVVLEKDGKEYTRVKEVMDVWFDSGAVPFAQDANDREKPGDFKNILYPADFISEAIDQTRGWFYTLHAIGILMEKGPAYKNVICLGHIMDKEGKKMSKSIGNVVDPWEQIEKYGVDTLRLWMYSVNQPGESKNFDERSVDEIQKRVFNLVDNVFAFYELYRDAGVETPSSVPQSNNILDAWILTKLGGLVLYSTTKLEGYQLLEPTRAIRAFIDDLSTWYVRRSRDRLKAGETEAKATLYFVLKTISKLLAPFAPFYADDLYQKLRTPGDPLSVHLDSWPALDASNEELLKNMDTTRKLVSSALELRSSANIKVRQPLQKLTIKNDELGQEFLDIIRDELNVKEVTVNKDLATEIELDPTITPELMLEGRMRDIVRSIQEMRKGNDLNPGDIMEYSVAEEDREIFERFKDQIVALTNIEIK